MSVHREIVDEWESWEHLILEDLERIEHRIQKFYSAISHRGSDKEDFVRERLRDLINQSTNSLG